MKSPDNSSVYLDHPKFSSYVGILRQSIKPECKDCGYSIPFLGESAIQILKQAASLNRRSTRIVHIDPAIESKELLAAQARLVGCNGQLVVENDMELSALVIRSIHGDDPELMAKKISEILPITTDCSIRIQDNGAWIGK